MSRLGKALKRHIHQVTHPAETVKKSAKSTTRHIARGLVVAGPAITAVGAGVLSFFFTPAAGAALTGLASLDARYGAGKVAARDKGLHGREGNEYARNLEKKVAIAGAIGTGLGTVASIAAPIIAGTATAAPAAAPAAAPGVASASQFGAQAGFAAAAASSAPGVASASTLGATLGTAAAASAAPAAAAGAGLLSTVTKTLGVLAGPAANVLGKVLTPAQQQAAAPLLDLAGAKFGGEGSAVPGTGDTSTPDGNSEKGSGGSTVAKAAIAVTAVGGAVLAFKLLKKKAA